MTQNKTKYNVVELLWNGAFSEQGKYLMNSHRGISAYNWKYISKPDAYQKDTIMKNIKEYNKLLQYINSDNDDVLKQILGAPVEIEGCVKMN